MRKLLIVFAMLATLSFAAAPAAMAQDDVDIDAVGQTVMDTDLDTLMTDLQTPPADEALPAGFTNATYLDPADATGNEGVLPASDLEGSEGGVAYTVDYDPTASASPEAGAAGSGFAVRIASVNYIFIDEEISSDDLEDFREGAESGIAGDDQGEATVETIEINGTEAVLMTYVIEDSGMQSVVKMYAVPVGNAMVVTMLVEAGETVDTDMLQADAEALTLASISHLGDTAEGGQ